MGQAARLKHLRSNALALVSWIHAPTKKGVWSDADDADVIDAAAADANVRRQADAEHIDASAEATECAEVDSVHMFPATASTYDDWFHREFLLQDLDFYSYVAY